MATTATGILAEDRAETREQVIELLTSERAAARTRIVNRLRDDGIAVYLIRRGAADRPGLPPRVVEQIAAGQAVDTRAVIDGEAVLGTQRQPGVLERDQLVSRDIDGDLLVVADPPAGLRTA